MKPIDWTNLGFEYTEADYLIRCSYKDGHWGELRATKDKYLNLHACATALQYGQEAFEGLKAIRGVDGKVRIFRMEENAKRLRSSAEALYMAPVPTELFTDAIRLSLKLNIDYLPPYGTGASLYFRPLLIGTSPRLGVGPGSDYEFVVIASPIGEYFKGKFHTTTFIITRHVDRAAPLGTGAYKVGGNYAASFRATEPNHQQGYGTLFLDSKYHRFIDECGAANFIGIKDNTYITPRSRSILPSITNNSFMSLAVELGMRVERRHIEVSELSSFEECAACGTASIISPIGMIIDPDKGRAYDYGREPGAWSRRLYDAILDVQHGRRADNHGWCEIADI